MNVIRAKKSRGPFASALMLATGLLMQGQASHAQSNTHVVDSDSDGLIEINSLEDLWEIRNDLQGKSSRGSSVGCPSSGCLGYELTRDLDFDTNGNGVLDSGDWNYGQSWTPISGAQGVTTSRMFSAVFSGNGHTIRNLPLTRIDGVQHYGLFGAVHNAQIRLLTLSNVRVNVSGGNRIHTVGTAVGLASSSTLENVYVDEASVTSDTQQGLGGVVGYATDAFITGTHFTGEVRHTNLADTTANVGGVAGKIVSTAVYASYAKGSVTGPRAGGLVDTLVNSDIARSYSNVHVFGQAGAGGLVNVALYNASGSSAASQSHGIVETYALGSVTSDTDSAGGLIRGVYAYDGVDVKIESSYSSNVISNRLQGTSAANLIQFAYYTVDIKDSYWAIDPAGSVLPARNSNVTTGGYLLSDLQCASYPQGSGCRHPDLFKYWGTVVWDYGTIQQLPALKLSLFTPWLSADTPSSTADDETLPKLKAKYPELDCDTPIWLRAKEKKSPYVFFPMHTLYEGSDDEVLRAFSANVGLVCRNTDQVDGRCENYEVSYLCDETPVGGTVRWTKWRSDDTPNGDGDYEKLPTDKPVCAAGEPKGILGRVRGSVSHEIGPPQRLAVFDNTQGLKCLNSENPCKDYEVQLMCLKVGDRTSAAHRVYTSLDSYVQARTYLQADGRVRSEIPGAPAGPVKAIAQGYLFSLAVKDDGSVASWGSLANPAPAGLTQVRQVAAGANYALAIKEDGMLAAWGKVNNVDAKVPSSLANKRFIAADATLGDIAAIQEDGTLVVWSGQSGSLRTNPAAWQGKKFKQVCGTYWHVVAVDTSGVVRSWNTVNNSLVPAMDTPPVTSGPVSSVYCGSDHAALVQTDGRVIMWGEKFGNSGTFDSKNVSGFPRIKGAAFNSYRDPQFLTEDGAIVDTEGNVVTSVDDL